jgi:ABC-type sugar transport system ATPase subunit
MRCQIQRGGLIFCVPQESDTAFNYLVSDFVLIARALAQKSDILLLDEPTTFLDPKHETEVLGLVRTLSVE